MKMLALLCLVFWSAKAITTETNVDTLEPTVIRSPAAANDSEDGFGWAVLLHQIEPLLEGDSMNTALMKTRCSSGTYRSYLHKIVPVLAAAAQCDSWCIISCCK